jgi:hypothetical protein
MMIVPKSARALLSHLNVFFGLALLALLALSGCQEVRKCKRGDPGCIDGPVNDDGECAAGLVKRGGDCVEPTSSSGCNCAADELCDENTKTCLAYCAPVGELPKASPTPPSCTPVKTASDNNPPPLTFDELCEAACLQNCVRAQAFCPDYECDPASCERGVARARCLLDCPGMDTTCMTNRCMERSMTACNQFMCPNGTTRSCQDVTCSDSCMGNNNDGFCDDGDPSSATYSFCPYGRDCTDCGPRRGSSRPARRALGEPCPEGQDVSCEGYNDDFLKTQAWCLRFSSASGAAFRCVPDCTTEDGAGECADGYECQAVKTSSGEPYRDATNNRTPGYACVPQICEL